LLPEGSRERKFLEPLVQRHADGPSDPVG
jgi:hypothetical protein